MSGADSNGPNFLLFPSYVEGQKKGGQLEMWGCTVERDVVISAFSNTL